MPDDDGADAAAAVAICRAPGPRALADLRPLRASDGPRGACGRLRGRISRERPVSWATALMAEELQAIFPNASSETLEAVLALSGGDVNVATNYLLEGGDIQEVEAAVHEAEQADNDDDEDGEAPEDDDDDDDDDDEEEEEEAQPPAPAAFGLDSDGAARKRQNQKHHHHHQHHRRRHRQQHQIITNLQKVTNMLHLQVLALIILR